MAAEGTQQTEATVLLTERYSHYKHMFINLQVCKKQQMAIRQMNIYNEAEKSWHILILHYRIWGKMQ
jgi:hypothetical protein